MTGFAYAAPDSVEAAVAVLADHHSAGRRAQVLAGGTDLMVQLRSVDRQPRAIIDIKGVPGATGIHIDSDTITVGAATPGRVITTHPDLEGLLPGLVEAVDLIGSTQIQGRCSPGGNLCNSSPAGDTIPAMIACAAVCIIAGPSGQREVPVEDFCTGVNRNVLRADEFLLALRFPRPAARTGSAYLRFIPRTEMDIAVAGVGVAVTLDTDGTCSAARVAIGAVAPTPLLVAEAASALLGTTLDDDALAAAGAACSAAANPINDKRGTIAYRRKVVAVLCRRAAANAARRARGEALGRQH